MSSPSLTSLPPQQGQELGAGTQPLGIKRHANAIMPKNFDQMTAFPAKNVKVAVGLVSMLSSLSVVVRILPASEEGMRLGGLETSLHFNLLDLDRPQPAEARGAFEAFEERGRQFLARLADGERGEERGGGATAPAFPTIRRSSGFRYRVDGIVWQRLKNVRQLQVAARYARLGRWAPGNKLVHG
jgi:hypothetical protein